MTIETPTRSTASATTDAVTAELERLLADTYTLYLKTHGYHWNVTGPQFRELHLLFEEQYLEMRDAVDEIAERIRMLGATAPGSSRQMARLASISEDEGAPDAMEMVRRLAVDHQALIGTARGLLAAAELAGDVASVDLATRRIAVHEKMRWMLHATSS
jgi:starvation-inducible DNA-binding protein